MVKTVRPALVLDPEGADLAHLAEGVFRRYGYDLRHFAGGYLRRRLEAAMRWEEVESLMAFKDRLLTRPELMERLLMSLSGGPRHMFKEAGFHRYIRREIVPGLRTYPFIRIWLPGCSNGPEVWGLAVLLAEEGLYDRCRLYATDLSQEAVRKAKDGQYPLSALRKWAEGHAESGGKGPCSATSRWRAAKPPSGPPCARTSSSPSTTWPWTDPSTGSI